MHWKRKWQPTPVFLLDLKVIQDVSVVLEGKVMIAPNTTREYLLQVVLEEYVWEENIIHIFSCFPSRVRV